MAALTVAISLTIATADTIKIAEIQYSWGAQNASVLQMKVMGSTELKSIRLISDTFLWLAQAQTLIRLFPRQREKIIIKWAAFALISLDVIFSAINSFKFSDNGINFSGPTNFVHPIPALSYLFQLTLGVLYAAWVIYYALMKKRYAFYHPLMKNIFLVAVISIVSIIVPIVFFILDIVRPVLTAWGDYVRWVGAAAASVVVWEWVERIEALEREEKRDGILGREVFDGDDTLEVNASEFPWFRQRKSRKDDPDNRGNGGRQQESHGWTSVSAIAGQARGRGSAHDAGRRNQNQWRQQRQQDTNGATGPMGEAIPPLWPSRPAATATPISRTDTASAASTVYAVRFQPVSETTNRTPDLPMQQMSDSGPQSSPSRTHIPNNDSSSTGTPPSQGGQNGRITFPPTQRPADLESGHGGPQEQQTQATSRPSRLGNMGTFLVGRGADDLSRWDLKARLEEFAANQADRIRERLRPTLNTESLPVTVIPAPARKGTALQQVLEEEETRSAGPSSSEPASRPGNSSSTRDRTDEITPLDRTRSGPSTSDPPLSPSNPPLWPGVQHRSVYDDDDDYSFEDDSIISDAISVDRERRDSGDGSRPSQAPRDLAASR